MYRPLSDHPPGEYSGEQVLKQAYLAKPEVFTFAKLFEITATRLLQRVFATHMDASMTYLLSLQPNALSETHHRCALLIKIPGFPHTDVGFKGPRQSIILTMASMAEALEPPKRQKSPTPHPFPGEDHPAQHYLLRRSNAHPAPNQTFPATVAKV